MTNPMCTEQRFKAIIDAYGASPERWPDAERAGATAFMAEHAAVSDIWLDEARMTDAMLDVLKASDHAEDTQRLLWRTLAQMPEEPSNLLSFGRMGIGSGRRAGRPLPMVMATGIGIAACLAGALLGVNFSLTSLDDMRAQTVLEQAQMLDVEN